MSAASGVCVLIAAAAADACSGVAHWHIFQVMELGTAGNRQHP